MEAVEIKVTAEGFDVVGGGNDAGRGVEKVLRDGEAEEEIPADCDVSAGTTTAVDWGDFVVIGLFVEDMDVDVDGTKGVDDVELRVRAVSGVEDVEDCGLAVVSKSVSAEKIKA